MRESNVCRLLIQSFLTTSELITLLDVLVIESKNTEAEEDENWASNRARRMSLLTIAHKGRLFFLKADREGVVREEIHWKSTNRKVAVKINYFY